MEMNGEQLIPSPVALVWQGLNDPEVLKSCINGCQTLESTSESEFRAEIVAAVGPVKAKFKGNLALLEIVPLKSYSLKFEGTGGPAGFVKGSAKVALEERLGSTLLIYSASFNIGGKLAQIGSRLVGGIAKSTAEDFFAKFSAQMIDYSPSTLDASPTIPKGQSIPNSNHAAGRENQPSATGAPVALPLLQGQGAQVGHLVPVVVWLPLASMTEQTQLQMRNGVMPQGTKVRDLIHPAWWILGTAATLGLVYLAFLRT